MDRWIGYEKPTDRCPDRCADRQIGTSAQASHGFEQMRRDVQAFLDTIYTGVEKKSNVDCFNTDNPFRKT